MTMRTRLNQGSLIAYLSILALAGCATIDRSSDDTSLADEESFEDRLARFSEEALITEATVDETGTILVGSKTCRVAERDRLDELVPISDARKLQSEAINAPFGLPVAIEPNENEVLLYQDEYILIYNTQLKMPVFATYRLRAEDVVKGERVECFRVDPRLETPDQSRTIDYHGDTDLDKGHLVPDADMQRAADTAMNTYFMSNMMPQFGSVNSGSWKYIEDATRLWAGELGEVIVVSGAIFDRDGDGERDADDEGEKAPPTFKVTKATAFYKVILHVEEDDSMRAIGFILPHIQTSTAPNKDYVPQKIRSVDDIEAITGFDLFPDLEDDDEDAMEAAIEEDLWCRRRCNGSS